MRHRAEYDPHKDARDHPTAGGVCRGRHCAWHAPKHALDTSERQTLDEG